MSEPTADQLLDEFLDSVIERGIDPYPAQEEAFLELFAGNNVVLTTPTGSGKSLVAEAAHFAALRQGKTSVYTAPIKALVSEKFFALCDSFGSDNVGMVTGDAAVNPEAPIICCTAEILANRALRRGSEADANVVIIDEFHYYGDPQRGWAWQVPLLELEASQFLLMSATMGPTGPILHHLESLTGQTTVEVTSEERPVPLDFQYRDTPLHESLQALLDEGKVPAYIVHFTQADAMAAAQAFTSLKVLDKDQKGAVREAVGDFRFDSPVGKDLRRFIMSGIGVHHAGLLPRYRLLVEKLAQQGLLKLICGTDTLGVGVNIPIRSVLFTQLCKFDGTETRVLQVREFQQIAGRAGRKGFDDEGHVWAQAPEHWIENRRMEERAATDAKKRKKLVKRKPPEWGYAHWNEETFDKLVGGTPEPLRSSFVVSHQFLLNVLDRPGDGCAAVRDLLTSNHEPRKRQRQHIRRAVSMYRSLVDAEVVEALVEADEEDRMVRVTIDLQDDFALNQPLSLFAVEVLPELDMDDPDYALDVLSVVEGVLENPRPVLKAQLDRAKDELMFTMKAEGVEYEDRMDRLSEVEFPKPLGEFLWGCFRTFRQHHPWVGDETVRPKSVVREMYEMGFGFRDYVQFHGLKRSEGVLLRYLGDAYKGLVQNVPDEFKSEEVQDLQEWLGELVRQVDSSLIDEWERIQSGADLVETSQPLASEPGRNDVTTNHRAFAVMVRNEAFRLVSLLARRDYESLAEVPGVDGHRWRASELEEAIAPYWEEHDFVGIDADARSAGYFLWDRQAGAVTQILADPADTSEWRIEGTVDIEASRDAGEAVLVLAAIRRL
ncbi:MAG: DEAD/DEAH box helicase [Acidimicrobiales bacterium]